MGAPAVAAAFVPLIQETCGCMHHEADLVYRTHSDDGTGAVALRILRMRLAVAHCKGNGVVFRRIAHNLARFTGLGGGSEAARV
jgi:hypothetical protein